MKELGIVLDFRTKEVHWMKSHCQWETSKN
jgi:hypothetical protein